MCAYYASMNDTPGPLPIDPTKASVARFYDFLLGGKDNFAVDRAMAQKLLEHAPDARVSARQIKHFGARGVDYVVRQGVRQFIDLGSGMPTSPPSVHDVARNVASDSNVVYVDYDPVVVAHNHALRDIGPGLTTILGDIAEPEAILSDSCLQETVDLSKPVGVLLCSVLQTIPDTDQAVEVMRRYREGLAPGSYLILAHISTSTSPQVITKSQSTAADHGYPYPAFRSDAELMRFFDGFELVEPGLIDIKDWHPDTESDADNDIPTVNLRGGVGRLAG